MTHIHLRIKFTPRWDTPADSNYQNLKVEIDENFLKVEALGLTTAAPIKYNLTLDRLYAAFNTPPNSRWTVEA